MKKLFFIGNGFDIAHKLPTSTCYFKEFLERVCKGKRSYMPMTYFDQDGATVADRESTAGLLVELIDSAVKDRKWQDFEESMGKFDYLSFFDEYDMNEAIDDDDDDEMFRVAYIREDLASDLNCCIKEIKKLFAEWIETINIEQAICICMF